MREEDLFTQLQQALLRARGDRLVNVKTVSFTPDIEAAPSTPSQTGAGGDSPIRGGPRHPVVPPTVPEEPAKPVVSHTDFFGDEMRTSQSCQSQPTREVEHPHTNKQWHSVLCHQKSPSNDVC